jgi:membrane associated rhomboid family serine protease
MALENPGDVGGIAWWAHVGGFGAGMLLHFLFVRRPYRPAARDELALEDAWLPYDYRRSPT